MPKKPYFCEVCRRKFRHLYLLLRHLREETEKEKRYKKGWSRWHMGAYDKYLREKEKERARRRQ